MKKSKSFIQKITEKINPWKKKQVSEVLLEIKDNDGHVLPYCFKKSPIPGSPLLVIMHGNGNNKNIAKFRSDEYNILCPLDCYGWRKLGSWYLGEHGNFFVKDLLIKLISEVLSMPNVGKELYLWGSSMGGYAAILYGMLLEAHAIFAHIPQTNFIDSHWYETNKTFIDFIFGENGTIHPYRDLAQFALTHKGKFPLFFLSFNRFDRPFYNAENMDPLIESLNKIDKNYFLIVHPQQGHKKYHSLAHYAAFFKVYAKEIRENFENQDCAMHSGDLR